MPDRAKFQRHERDVAVKLGGSLQPGSGAFAEKGDVVAGNLLIECKSTTLRTFPIPMSTVEKIVSEAREKNLAPALALRLGSIRPGMDEDWLMLPMRIVAELLRRPRKK